MKIQGRAPTVESGHKVEPKSKAINPGWAGQIGTSVGAKAAQEDPSEGRGYHPPPPAAKKVHKGGSQGSY